MVIKFDDDIGKNWISYLKPFHRNLWYSIFGLLIITTISLAIIAYLMDIMPLVNIFNPFYAFCKQGNK